MPQPNAAVSSPKDRIRQLVAKKPGLKAQQIAAELGLEKTVVATALYAFSTGEVVQDSSYRWWPRAPQVSPESAAAPHPFLARLCRYYLDCLSRESGSGISIPSSAEDVEYVALNALPFSFQLTEPPTPRAVRRIVQKVRRERGQLTLYIGYAVRVRLVGQHDYPDTRLEPALLYPIEETDDEQLRPATGVPMFNLEVLKNLPSFDSGNIVDEAIQLSEELGLANADDDLPQWDEVIFRLRQRRPDWDWKEELNPYTLSQGPRLSELAAPGIYNRAMLFAATRSPFTYGLEMELRKLAQLDDEAVRETALGLWLRGGSIETAPVEDRPILEILPLNTEQRQAVVQGLSAPLTVVTGPPGTGKSQVVASLLVNQAWHSSSVLFASRNNHAVDVVESRVNALGPSPLLLRLGKDEHHAQLAQHLTATLAESSSPDDSAGYTWQKEAHEEMRGLFQAVQAQIATVVNLRNLVDELERAAEPARAIFGAERFRNLRTLGVEAARARIDALSAALDAARESRQPAMVRLVWDSTKSRYQRVAEAGNALRDDAASLAVPIPDADTFESWDKFCVTLLDRIAWADRVRNYLRALDELRAAPPLEALAAELTRIADESGHNSAELWQSWLRLRPGRWSPEQRKLLGEYLSLLQMIAGGDYNEGAGRKVFRRYYQLFPRVTKLLPCWAVTSLSARGRLPFEPGIFDLIVIDEASQCDIASALPLLFRARRAVIMGDPLQLKHVSTVVPQQDRLMLAAHGLASEGSGVWAYSVNSLFDLARTFCRHEDLVNLRDHHRSHRDIIAFSNRHFYRGRLRVVTDHDALKHAQSGSPAVRWIEVTGRVVRPAGGGAMNSPEAAAVVAEVRRLVMEEGFNGSIGVVTPFRAQANRIRTIAHQDRAVSQKLGGLQFIVDTVHGFQGDERDVIVFSPVVSAGIGDSPIRFLKGNGNLFNVAITRARSELIVVGDRHAALHSGVNYLSGFAEYTQDLAEQNRTPAATTELGPDYPIISHPELVSEWERVFYRAMYCAGLRPVPQYEEAPYTLDFALFAVDVRGDRRLDIEIDGENYHRHWDGELCRRDQIRSRRLNDAGWDVLRLWVYEIRDDLEGSLVRVKAWAML